MWPEVRRNHPLDGFRAVGSPFDLLPNGVEHFALKEQMGLNDDPVSGKLRHLNERIVQRRPGDRDKARLHTCDRRSLGTGFREASHGRNRLLVAAPATNQKQRRSLGRRWFTSLKGLLESQFRKPGDRFVRSRLGRLPRSHPRVFGHGGGDLAGNVLLRVPGREENQRTHDRVPDASRPKSANPVTNGGRRQLEEAGLDRQRAPRRDELYSLKKLVSTGFVPCAVTGQQQPFGRIPD